MINYKTYYISTFPLLFIAFLISCNKLSKIDSNKHFEKTVWHNYSHFPFDSEILNVDEQRTWITIDCIEKISPNKFIYKSDLQKDSSYSHILHVDYENNKYFTTTKNDTFYSYFISKEPYILNKKTKYTVYKTISISNDGYGHTLDFFVPEFGIILSRGVGGKGSCIPPNRQVFIKEYINETSEIKTDLQNICNAIFSSAGLENSFYDISKNEIDSLEKLNTKN